MQNQQENNKYAPIWSIKAFAKMIMKLESLDSSLIITENGFHYAKLFPEAYKKVKQKEILPDEHYLIKLSEAAQKEIDNNFPFLFSNATISLWSYLEAAVKHFIFDLLKNKPEYFEIERIKKIKISLAEYSKLDEDERITYIIENYEKSIAQGTPYGIKRFEKLLEPFSYSGDVPSDVVKDVFELAQIRNLVLHKSGVVDNFFNSKCGWLNLKVGEQFNPTKDHFHKYLKAVNAYATIVIHRIGESFGAEMGDIDEYMAD